MAGSDPSQASAPTQPPILVPHAPESLNTSGQPVRFPVISDIMISPSVQAAITADWNLGLSDYRERGAWIIWQGSPTNAAGQRDDVNATYLFLAWPMGEGALDEDDVTDPRDAIHAPDTLPATPATGSLWPAPIPIPLLIRSFVSFPRQLRSDQAPGVGRTSTT
jgi:hypothetical protein